jgi:predicted CoA-binding protein
MDDYQDPTVVRRLLGMSTIAVVGLSSNPARPSHGVAAYLLEHGYTVIPVNPRESTVLGQRAYESLADVPVRVDVVDVFREASAVPDIARDSIRIGARGLWLQLGVINAEGIELAAAAGLDVVADLCIKIEHARYAA